MNSESPIPGRAPAVMAPAILSWAPVSAVQADEDPAERWRHWQLRNVATSRKDARRMRIVFTALFAALGTWLCIQLFAPSLLP